PVKPAAGPPAPKTGPPVPLPNEGPARAPVPPPAKRGGAPRKPPRKPPPPAGPPGPPGPAKPRVLTGPALGIAPAWGVRTVLRTYAPGPASPATMATAATPALQLRARYGSNPITSAAATPPATTTGRSHGSQCGVRSSRTNDQTDVAATDAASTARATQRSRLDHIRNPPVPITPPMAGARATV